jgi:hypothetical protein
MWCNRRAANILFMKIAILDDYFDTVRTLPCFTKCTSASGPRVPVFLACVTAQHDRRRAGRRPRPNPHRRP